VWAVGPRDRLIVYARAAARITRERAPTRRRRSRARAAGSLKPATWLNRNRALLIRWSKKEEDHLALLQLASGLIALKKAHAGRLALAQPG